MRTGPWKGREEGTERRDVERVTLSRPGEGGMDKDLPTEVNGGRDKSLGSTTKVAHF